jgi:hypothetical protein
VTARNLDLDVLTKKLVTEREKKLKISARGSIERLKRMSRRVKKLGPLKL